MKQKWKNGTNNIVQKFLQTVKFWGLFQAYHPQNWKFVQKNVMGAYVHIEYSTYQSSEESKGGWNPTLPPVLAVQKKAWYWEG